jgi:Tol biopolymer transport system component
MPNLDDELRRRLQRAGRRVPTDGVYERLSKRRDRKAFTHRVGSGALAVAVVAGSTLGLFGLQRAFRGSGQDPTVAQTGTQQNGGSTTVGFTRTFNGQCDGPGHEAGASIFTVDTVTGEERKLPFHGNDNWQQYAGDPEFSPDGTEVAYTNMQNHHLDVTDVATGATRTLVSDLQVVDAPHWSADGSTIVFNDLDARGNVFTVDVVGADGTGLTRLTEGQIPVWTGDGQIAFMRRQPPRENIDPKTGTILDPIYGGTARFLTMNADGTDIRQRYEAPGNVPIEDPEWSPDGSRVAAAALFQGSWDIFAVDLALQAPIQLIDDPAVDGGPAWSPDGSQIAFNTGRWSPTPGTVTSTIAVMNADGSDVRQLTSTCWNDYFATWVKDDSVVKTLPLWDPKNAD